MEFELTKELTEYKENVLLEEIKDLEQQLEEEKRNTKVWKKAYLKLHQDISNTLNLTTRNKELPLDFSAPHICKLGENFCE